MDIIGLYFKVANFIGLVPSKMKLAILVFLYCGEFVKNSIEGRQINRSNESWVMVTWIPPLKNERLKTLPSCNFVGGR